MPLLTQKKDGIEAPSGAKRTLSPRHGRVPTKNMINLATVGIKKINWLIALPAIVLICFAASLFGKFLVYDRLAEVYAAERSAAAVHRQLSDSYARLDSFGELNDLYAHYTYSGMTREELGRVDRVAVMEVLERVVFPRTEVEAWTLSGNELTLNINGSTLQEINNSVQALLSEPLVDYCTVNTAFTETQRDSAVSPEDPDAWNRVTASIVVYFKNPEEGAS